MPLGDRIEKLIIRTSFEIKNKQILLPSKSKACRCQQAPGIVDDKAAIEFPLCHQRLTEGILAQQLTVNTLKA